MRIHKLSAAIAMGVAALGLSACEQSINTTVSRYQAMPAPQGQTFFVVPAGGLANNGGLEFQRFAGIVAQQLQARGYSPATNAQSANMIVQFGYGIDHGQMVYVDDPFWYGGGINSYVEYHSQIDLHIRAAGTNAPLFDGRAQARSDTNRLDIVVPSLVDAMFTNFPGQNGETVKITIPARNIHGQPTAKY